MVADLLWPVRLQVICHPSIASQAVGKSLADFIDGNELLHVRLSELPRHHLWTQYARRANLTSTHVERGLVFDTAALVVQYALRGEGLALVDNFLFADLVRSGQLVSSFRHHVGRWIRLLFDHAAGGVERHRHRAISILAHRAIWAVACVTRRCAAFGGFE